MKKCSQCLLEKDDLLFYKNSNKCKPCYISNVKLRAKNNPAKSKDAWRKYYDSHSDYEKQRSKRNHEKNKEYNLERQRQYDRKKRALIKKTTIDCKTF